MHYCLKRNRKQFPLKEKRSKQQSLCQPKSKKSLKLSTYREKMEEPYRGGKISKRYPHALQIPECSMRAVVEKQQSKSDGFLNSQKGCCRSIEEAGRLILVSLQEYKIKVKKLTSTFDVEQKPANDSQTKISCMTSL